MSCHFFFSTHSYRGAQQLKIKKKSVCTVFYQQQTFPRGLTWEKLRGNGRLPKHDDPSTFDVAQKRSQEKSSDWEVYIGSVALLSHNTLKLSAILGISFFVRYWWLDMGILSFKILLRQDDNENFFVATITTKKTITTMKILDQNWTKKGSSCGLLI